MPARLFHMSHMGADDNAVVNSRTIEVRGVKGLFVVGGSTMPTLVSGKYQRAHHGDGAPRLRAHSCAACLMGAGR